MSVLTDKMDALLTSKAQQDNVVKAIVEIKICQEAVARADAALELLAATGSFDTIDSGLKTALVAAAVKINAANNALTSAEVTELYETVLSNRCPNCLAVRMEVVPSE